jgi:hypothetical protein
MLLPKGNTSGYVMELFLMFSDDNWERHEPERSSSYCGLKDQKYPDKKAMGFPFDRKIEGDKISLEKFAEKYSNMFKRDLVIIHTGERILRV